MIVVPFVFQWLIYPLVLMTGLNLLGLVSFTWVGLLGSGMVLSATRASIIGGISAWIKRKTPKTSEIEF